MEELNYPFEIRKMDKEINEKKIKNLKGETDSFIQIGPKKYSFPSSVAKHAPALYNFTPRSDDIWTVAFPRSGSTLTQELIWLLSNNLNFEEAANRPLFMRFPFFEYPSYISEETKQEMINQHEFDSKMYNETKESLMNPVWEMLANTKGPRFIKTHLPLSLLPPNLLKCGCKIIYLARNPKDVAVSYFHFAKTFRTNEFVGDFSAFWYFFRNDLAIYTPFFEHIKEGWQNRNNSNVLFLFYEDYIKDLKGSIKKVANFLNKTFSDDDYDRLEKHLQIENFKKNPSVNVKYSMKALKICNEGESDFIRAGKNGDWKNYFTEEMVKEADQWISENLKEINLQFPNN